MTPIQTRWLQHLASTARIPPHELARRLRQPLEVLAQVWGVAVEDLMPPKPPEPARSVPIERQLAAPEPIPHLTRGDFSHEAHAGIPVDGSSGPVISARPKPKPPRPTRTDTAPDSEDVGSRYERLRAIQEERPLAPPIGPRRLA